MKIFTVFCLLVMLADASPMLADNRQPNVIIFLMDDMGYGDVYSLNPDGAGFATPNLDALVKAGVSFTQAHSSASVCAPTRYALLSGNHVYRGRQPNGTWSHFQGSQIMPGQRTIADMLRGAGYSTAFFGKGHLGSKFLRKDGQPARNFSDADLTQRFLDGPLDHGFDYSLILPGGIQSEPYAFFHKDRLARWNNDRKDWEVFDTDAEARKKFRGEKRGKKSSVYAMDNWSTETVGPLLMRDALGFIDRHVADQGKDKPFFIHYCSQAGHSPYAPPVAFNPKDPLNTDDVSAPGAVAIAGQTVNKRTDMILEGDVALGLFIEKLRELEILKDTLILFTSDNGAAVGPSSKWTNPIYKDVKDESGYGGDRLEVNSKNADQVHRNAQGVAADGSPLRGEKGFVYEGGHRIPFIVRWDNGIPANQRVNDQLISLHDVYATLAAIAGAQLKSGQANDSFDFSSIWKSPEKNHPLVRSSLYIQSNRPWEQNNKKVYNTWAAYQAAHTDGALDVWKAVLQYNTRELDGKAKARGVELFHLSEDPSEFKSLTNSGPRLTEIERQFRADSQQSNTAPQSKR
jgi:arylsulfatase A-like enzyme